MNGEKEMLKTKHINYILGIIVLFFVIAIASYHLNRTFSTSKWLNNPEERTAIVDNLLKKHELVGMNEADVVALLGEPNNDSGYFNADNRYVYYLGTKRGLISTDSEWLILDFTEGIVSDFFIGTD